MSTPSPPPPRQRFLRRAANILSSNGQPIPSLRVTLGEPDRLERSRENSGGIGESIKQTFRSLRRLSSSGRSASTHNGKGHERSQSEAFDTRPAVLRSKSTTDKYNLDNDRLAPIRPLTQMTSSSTQAEAVLLSPDILSPDFTAPPILVLGTPMTKVSPKKQKKIVVKLDPDLGQISYESKKNRIIPIENIKELRSGSDARYYRQQFHLDAKFEERWITIIYVLESGYRTLHLVADTKDVFQMWDITLRKMYAIRQQLMSGLGNIEMRQLIWEKQYWKSTDREMDQKVNFEDVEKMCHRLNINPSRDDMLRWFKTADVQNRGYLDFEDLRRLVKALKTRPELDRLYKKLSKGGPFDYPVFESFMREKQESTLSVTELQRLFAKFISPPQEVSGALTKDSQTPAPESQDQAIPPESSTTWETGVWKLKNFTTFLLSADNSPFSDHHGKIYMDMTRPLPEYYVSTSHNTYLVGHQLVGDSTIEGYIRALLHSCRSVELDVYDGDSEPMIYHGLTLTSKVSVREVCEAIMKYAFVASPYPIIISAEIHCGMVQQDLLAKIMREVFGDALISAPADGRPRIDVLPSPEDLKGKVLLKAKNLYVSESEGLRSKEVVVDASSTETTSSYETDVLSDVKSELKKVGLALNRVASKRRRPSQTKPQSQLHQSSPPNGSFLKPSTTADNPEKSKVKMSFELLALLVYTVGVKCRGINKKETYAPEHVFSLSETTANKLLKEGMMDLMKHNRTHVVRIYPKGARISSTNYAPHKYWAAGAQLVALNWQTFDLGIMINNAMFQRNGRAGYVLKPLALREANKQLLSRRTTHLLKVTIISAQQLPRPKDSSGHEIEKGFIDPYVEVSVHAPDWSQFPLIPDNANVHNNSPSTNGHNGGGPSPRMMCHKTGVVKNNGFNPVWEESFSLQFDCVEGMKDLIFVRFEVKQENKDGDESLAQYVISLGSLLPGYRHLPLHDSHFSQYLFSTLFVYTDIIDI